MRSTRTANSRKHPRFQLAVKEVRAARASPSPVELRELVVEELPVRRRLPYEPVHVLIANRASQKLKLERHLEVMRRLEKSANSER